MKTLQNQQTRYWLSLGAILLSAAGLNATPALSPMPSLRAELLSTSKSVHLSWPGSATDCTLYATTELSASINWSPVTELVNNGGHICAALPLDGQAGVFCLGPAAENTAAPVPVKPVFVTAIASMAEEREAAVLMDSIRAFGGAYRSVPIHVLVANPASASGQSLAAKGAQIQTLEIDQRFRSFPFAVKVHACAQMEALLDGQADWLVWLDPKALVFAPLTALDVSRHIAVSIRPVHYQNVGSPARQQPDTFWRTVYTAAGVDTNQMWNVQSFVDGQEIRAYFNCAFMACRPECGLLRAWREVFTALLDNSQLRARVAGDAQHSTYLHQAVLSAVILARLNRDQINIPAPSFGYPLSEQSSIPKTRRFERLGQLVTVLYEGPLARCFSSISVEADFKPWLVAHGINL